MARFLSLGHEHSCAGSKHPAHLSQRSHPQVRGQVLHDQARCDHVEGLGGERLPHRVGRPRREVLRHWFEVGLLALVSRCLSADASPHPTSPLMAATSVVESSTPAAAIPARRRWIGQPRLRPLLPARCHPPRRPLLPAAGCPWPQRRQACPTAKPPIRIRPFDRRLPEDTPSSVDWLLGHTPSSGVSTRS